VPVYAVGCERGVHFYAMQLIEGQNLANLIEELRGRAAPLPSHSSPPHPALSPDDGGESGVRGVEIPTRLFFFLLQGAPSPMPSPPHGGEGNS